MLESSSKSSTISSEELLHLFAQMKAQMGDSGPQVILMNSYNKYQIINSSWIDKKLSPQEASLMEGVHPRFTGITILELDLLNDKTCLPFKSVKDAQEFINFTRNIISEGGTVGMAIIGWNTKLYMEANKGK